MIPREVHIKPVLNGYLVTVGCQTLVYNNNKELARDLGEYLFDPAKTEKAFSERALHRELLNGPCTPSNQRLVAQDPVPAPVPRHDRIADELRAAVQAKPCCDGECESPNA